MRLVSLFLMCLLGISAYGETISGFAKDYANTSIKLIFYTDQFSRLPIFVSEQQIDENGAFKFTYELSQTRLVALKIKDYRSNFYVTPNADYKVELSAFDELSAPPLSKDKYLPARILQQDNQEINRAIGLLNVKLDSFEQKHYLAFLQKKAKPYVTDFISELKLHELYDSNAFYTQYVDALSGSLMYKAQFPNKEIYEQSIRNRVNYQNIAFVNLLDDFYNKWMNRYNLTEQNIPLKNSISSSNLDSVHLLLKTNDFLKNDTIREIIMVKELFRLAVNDNSTNPLAVDKLLSELSDKAITKENKAIASYYLGRLRKLGIGALAPDFELMNLVNSTVKLSDYRGKYVYLDFWATWCKPCLKSMQVMRQLYPKYREHVEFISINIDDRKRRFERYLESNTYPWTILYAGSDEKIKNDYDVVLIPLYYLIDPNGKLIQSPAFSPGGGIERTFKQLFESNAKEEIKIWDWNFDPKNKE